ncbi:MAG: hypothetical protein J5939_08915, partial [Bacteroidales bacterium]|nr:hypothetical protein [Bacteroidales bacterium]
MNIKTLIAIVGGAVIGTSACRQALSEEPMDKTLYREVTVSLHEGMEDTGTRSIVSIEIEDFQKAALFAFDPGTGTLLTYGA